MPAVAYREVAVKPKTESAEIDELQRLLIRACSSIAELIDVRAKQRYARELRIARQTVVHAQRLLDEVIALEDILKPQPRPGTGLVVDRQAEAPEVRRARYLERALPCGLKR